MKKILLSLALASCSLLLPSCAYFQTHKNVVENNRYYIGFKVEKPDYIYELDGKYYIAAQECKVRKQYPTVRDTVFLPDEGPTLKSIGSTGRTVYQRISYSLAQVLQRKEGYATTQNIADEMKDGRTMINLDHAKKLLVQADIPTAAQASYVQGEQVPKKMSGFTFVKSRLWFICVDIPGTAAYNLAIPIMAPAIYFRRMFIDNETQGTL